MQRQPRLSTPSGRELLPLVARLGLYRLGAFLAALGFAVTTMPGLIGADFSGAENNISGPWNVTVAAQSGLRAGQMTACLMSATQTGSNFSNTLNCGSDGTATLSGTVTGDGRIDGQGYAYGIPFFVKGTLSSDGNTIAGTWSAADGSAGSFVATRVTVTAAPISQPTDRPLEPPESKPPDATVSPTPAVLAADGSPTTSVSTQASIRSSATPSKKVTPSPGAITASQQSGGGGVLSLLVLAVAIAAGVGTAVAGAIFAIVRRGARQV